MISALKRRNPPNPSSFQSTTASRQWTGYRRRTRTPWMHCTGSKPPTRTSLLRTLTIPDAFWWESAGGNIAYNAGLRAATEGWYWFSRFSVGPRGPHRRWARLANDLALPLISSIRIQRFMVGHRLWMEGCDGDLLVNRRVGFEKFLEEKGVHVEGHFFRGGYHGVFLSDPSMENNLYHLFIQIQKWMVHKQRLSK